MVRAQLGIAVAALIMVCSGCGLSATISAEPKQQPGQGTGTGPLENLDGTKPGLALLTSAADQEKARSLIGGLQAKGRGPKTGYDRDEFGSAWTDTADGVALARNGCDTRNDLLARDGQEVRFRSGSDCVVISMTLNDPYTGETLRFAKEDASAVQIDHVVPLSYSWQLGAARWSEEKREQLANDPLNLIPVDGPTNSSKGDSGPASWLPPNKAIRCAYAVRFAQVAAKYEMPVTTADKEIMLTQCGG